jgi:hypothetical protein
MSFVVLLTKVLGVGMIMRFYLGSSFAGHVPSAVIDTKRYPFRIESKI